MHHGPSSNVSILRGNWIECSCKVPVCVRTLRPPMADKAFPHWLCLRFIATDQSASGLLSARAGARLFIATDQSPLGLLSACADASRRDMRDCQRRTLPCSEALSFIGGAIFFVKLFTFIYSNDKHLGICTGMYPESVSLIGTLQRRTLPWSEALSFFGRPIFFVKHDDKLSEYVPMNWLSLYHSSALSRDAPCRVQRHFLILGGRSFLSKYLLWWWNSRNIYRQVAWVHWLISMIRTLSMTSSEELNFLRHTVNWDSVWISEIDSESLQLRLSISYIETSVF